MTITKGMRQAYDMQDFAYDTAMAMREQMRQKLPSGIPDRQNLPSALRAPNKDEAAIIAQLGKVWRDAQEQIRIHRGKPLPGSLTHEKQKRSKRSLSAGSSMLSMPLPEIEPDAQAQQQQQQQPPLADDAGNA